MPSSTLLLLTPVVKLPLISVEAELAATVLRIRVLHIEAGTVTGGTAVFKRLSKSAA